MENRQERYEFTCTINNIIYHIRPYRDVIVMEKALEQSPHKHFFMEFQYVFDGSLIIHDDRTDSSVTLLPGECAVIPKEAFHRVFIYEPVERLCFNLSIEYNQKCEHLHISDYYRIHSVYENVKEIRRLADRQVVSLMEQYRDISVSDDPFVSISKGVLLLNVILRLISILFSELPDNIRNQSNENSILTINRKFIIEEYIADRFAKPDKLAGLAELLYLSERQTRTLIRREFGKDYKELVIQQRMELANILLKNTDRSLDNISREVGYNSYSGFYLAYTKYYGVSPESTRKTKQPPTVVQ